MMNNEADHRLLVHFRQPAANEALLIEGLGVASPGAAVAHFRLARPRRGHSLGCACCVPRGPAAEALGRLFVARARGEVAWFAAVAVLATPAGEAAVRAALQQDRLCAGRFRVAECSSGPA
jgi:hypothetical protein